jgi:manganese transport protein
VQPPDTSAVAETSTPAVAADEPPSSTRSPTVDQILRRGRLRVAIALTGPALVASVAYIDPGNFATNFAGGSRFGYRLVWVVVLASTVAILVQYLSSKIGLATGRSLPAVCSQVLPRRVNLLLWIQAELVAIATDIAEFVGAALGLHLLFGLALFPAGLVTAAIAFLILGMQQRGYRRFETAILVGVVVVAASFGYLFLAVVHNDYPALVHGLVPHPPHGDALGLSVGIVGATVMPHVIYLHSALQANRVRARGEAQRQLLLAHNRRDCVVGLGIAGLVNVAMLCVAAAIPAGSSAHGTAAGSSAGDLSTVHASLFTAFGGVAAVGFAVALTASGLGSASVATYAGQVVMEGFMNWRLPLVVRRGVTMLPSLAVLATTSGTSGPLVVSQIALSFGIPFALIPMIVITRRADVMGTMVNRRLTTVAVSFAALLIGGLNVYLLATI